MTRDDSSALRREIARGETGAMPRAQLSGVVIAGATALVSGVSVFVNSYGVHSLPDASVYTTAKNLVAAALLAATVWISRATSARRRNPAPERHRLRRLEWVGIAYVGVIGGGIAFVLFFEGLARSSAAPAAFVHDTLVIWVALFAIPFLGERLSSWNLLAIGFLVVGEVVIVGGVGHLVPGIGLLLVLAATFLWALETVIAKHLLGVIAPGSLAMLRMGVGVVVLVGFVLASGHGATLLNLDGVQVGWVLATGALLALYVGTWMVALSRARALDVTSVLVASVVVTTLLELVANGRGSLADGVGSVLVAVGTAVVVWAWLHRGGLVASEEITSARGVLPS